jgi:hypothetical protein
MQCTSIDINGNEDDVLYTSSENDISGCTIQMNLISN